MFSNISSKIKTLAQVICWIGIMGSIIGGIVLIAEDDDFMVVGLAVMIVGSLFSWIGSFFAYGFGELIEKASAIERHTRGGEQKSEVQVIADTKRMDKLERLRAQGLITEEEYQQAVANNNM